MNDLFTQIIVDQREEKAKFRTKGWVFRKTELFIDLDSSLIQIITGVRRSGKSTLAHRALEKTNYAYLNFDDERLSNLSTEDLNSLLQSLYQVYGDFQYLFLDEVQNVDGWHLFVNRLQRNDLHIVITGSNSKLLSSELASHLTGRYNVIELFPFSFDEFLTYKKFDNEADTTKNIGLLNALFDEYLKNGGLPEIVKGTRPIPYISNLFNSIVTRDILFRYNIKHKQTFKDIAIHLINNFAREISYNRIKTLFNLGSEHTAKNYIAYLEEAYLIITLPKFSYKKPESLRYKKSYIIDSALALALSDNFTQNLGFLFENLIFLELLRRRANNSFEIYYYKKNIEVDFVLYSNRKVSELIQVCYNFENEKTRKREIGSLVQAAIELNSKKNIIITLNDKANLEVHGINIEVVPAREWFRVDTTNPLKY